jgi:hypothetical protein
MTISLTLEVLVLSDTVIHSSPVPIFDIHQSLLAPFATWVTLEPTSLSLG